MNYVKTLDKYVQLFKFSNSTSSFKSCRVENRNYKVLWNANGQCEKTWISNAKNGNVQNSAELTIYRTSSLWQFDQVCNTLHESALNHKS